MPTRPKRRPKSRSKKSYRLSPQCKGGECQRCPLHKHRRVTQQVTTEYHSKRTDVMFIGEGPGITEDDEGRPFIGESGRIVRRIVEHLDGSQKRVAYGNVIRCRATGRDKEKVNKIVDRTPTKVEVDCCVGNIKRDIAKLQPKLIVLCGLPANLSLAQDPREGDAPLDPNTKMGNIRGKYFVVTDSEGRKYPAIGTYHFAFILRNKNLINVFIEDITKAFLYVDNKLKDYRGRGKKCVILDTIPKVKKYLKILRGLSEDDIIAMDYETEGLDRINNKVLTIGFSHKEDRGYVIPYRHQESPWTGKEIRRVRKLLHDFFTDTSVKATLVAHNLKFEAAVTLDEFGAYLNAFPAEDTLMLAYALNEGRIKGRGGGPTGPGYGLKVMVEEWLDFYHYLDSDIAPTVAMRNKGRLNQVSIRALAEYNAMDCYATYRLYQRGLQIAAGVGYEEKLRKLSRHLLGKEVVFLAKMERNGFLVNKEQLRFLRSDESPIIIRLNEILNELYKSPKCKEANAYLLKQHKRVKGMKRLMGKAPWVLDLKKDKHKIALFVDIMGLKPPEKSKKTKQPSINDAFFQEFKDITEVALFSEWSKLEKIRNTYVEGIHRYLRTVQDMMIDSRVRCNFKADGTMTGRLASAEPNMQNIPSRSKHDMTKEIKRLFLAAPGNLLVCADYSQAEVRWLAIESMDKKLITAFRNVKKAKKAYAKNPSRKNIKLVKVDGDFHRQTAAQVFKKPAMEIGDDERKRSKSVVFGIVYGQTEYGLAQGLKIKVSEAREFQKEFMSQFNSIEDYLVGSEKVGFKNAMVESPIGRRRRLGSKFIIDPEVHLDKNGKPLEGIRGDYAYFKRHEDNICRNSSIQSIASDTNIMACILLQDYIEAHQKKWKIVNIVHDSIIAEVPEDEVEEYITVARSIMEDRDIFAPFGVILKIPFESDFTVGPNWGDQLDLNIVETWKLTCKKCGKSRKEEGGMPSNRRCEECGSKKVSLKILKGPLPKLMKQLRIDARRKAA